MNLEIFFGFKLFIATETALEGLNIEMFCHVNFKGGFGMTLEIADVTSEVLFGHVDSKDGFFFKFKNFNNEICNFKKIS